MKAINFFILIMIATVIMSHSLTCYAQQSITSLKVGDKVPDVALKFYRSAHQGIKFSDYRGKAMIIDVWATWCAPCIAAIPKMKEFQNKYGKELEILMMNDAESFDKIDRFIKKRESIPASKVTLPVILADSLMSKVLFQHKSLPCYFWIAKNGCIKYLTGGTRVTEKNIESFLKNETIEVEDVIISANEEKKEYERVFWKSEIRQDNALGLTRLELRDSGASRIFCYGSSVIDLFRFAYGTFHQRPQRGRSFVDPFPFNRVLYEADKPGNFGKNYFNIKKQSDTLYAYRQTAPDFSEWASMSRVMKSELEDWFGYSVAVEKRVVHYLSITIPDTTRFRDVKGKRNLKVTDTELYLNNIPLDDFIWNLTLNILGDHYFMSGYPLVNESGYKGVVGDIKIDNVNTNDPEALDQALSKFGIRIKVVERPLEMLVIRNATLNNKKSGEE